MNFRRQLQLPHESPVPQINIIQQQVTIGRLNRKLTLPITAPNHTINHIHIRANENTYDPVHYLPRKNNSKSLDVLSVVNNKRTNSGINNVITHINNSIITKRTQRLNPNIRPKHDRMAITKPPPNAFSNYASPMLDTSSHIRTRGMPLPTTISN
ncbi:hypothetical protein ACOSQ4_003290 [Xanthoceras sorbifolium]